MAVRTCEDSDTNKSSQDESCSYSSPEKKPLLESSLKLYPRRWYILTVFSLAGVIQACVWNTFGPIAQSAKAVYGWTDADIGMLANEGNIVFCLCIAPVAYLMDGKGLRVSMLLCTFVSLAGTSLRCITSQTPAATWLINVGQILNGLGGSVSFAGPPLVSATWFPPTQRATATALTTMATYVGIALAFIIGPLLVPEPTMLDTNMTVIENRTSMTFSSTILANTTLQNVTESHSLDRQRDAIMRLMYIECGAAGLLFLLVCVYFPSRPPTPPSITASLARTDYIKGLKDLMTHGPFWLIAIAYSVPTGVYATWAAVLDVNLNAINISQEEAGWLGFYAVVGGCVSGLVIARFADIFMRHLRLFLLLLFVLAAGSFLWLILIFLSYIPFNTVSLYLSCIFGGVFLNGAVPLFYELGCEASYPTAEGVTNGVLTFLDCIAGIIFLSVLQIPNIGVVWMNWCLLGSVVFSIPLLLLVKEKYTRTNIDTLEILVPPLNVEP